MVTLLIAMMGLQIDTAKTEVQPQIDTTQKFQVEQVYFDTKGTLMEITQGDAQRLKIFQNIPRFIKATAYKTAITEYSIEITYREGNKTYKRDSTLSETDFISLRTTIDSSLLSHPKIDRSGWGLYLLDQLQVASTEWAPMTMMLLPDGTRDEIYGATYLLTSAGGFFVPLYLTLDKSISMSQALLSWSWAHQGYGIGFVLRDLINWREYSDNYYDKGYAASALAGGILGSWTGYGFAGKQNLNPGRADLMAWMGYWGGVYGVFGAYILIPWGEENPNWDNMWKIKTCELSGVLGMVYGGYLWYTRAKDIYTLGDAIGYRTFTVLSALTSINIVSYFPWKDASEWESKLYIAIGMTINGFGMWKGLELFKPVNLEFVDGVALIGGAVGGGLLGGAVVALTTPDEKVGFSEVLAGGWAGYLLTYNLISKGRGAKGDLGAMFYPENLAALWMSKRQNIALSVPMATFKF